MFAQLLLKLLKSWTKKIEDSQKSKQIEANQPRELTQSEIDWHYEQMKYV